MADQFSEVSSQSWLGRIGSSIMGVLFGFVFIIGAVVLLGWNESRAITTAKSLKEGAASVVSVESASVDPSNATKLIHVTGDATTTEVLSDPMFAVSANGLRLTRIVAMYQWKEEEKSETKKNLGGGTDTVKTYTYDKTWSEKPIDSYKFKHPVGHANPGAMLAQDATIVAKNGKLGAFQLTGSLIDKMKGDEPIPLTDADLGKLKPALKEKAQLGGEGFYFGADPTTPVIGDQRVTFKILKPGTFSVLAQQVGNSFAPYQTRAGDEIERVESGAITAGAMFQHAASENATLTWILRAVGYVVVSIGIGLIFKPISVFGDVIPIVGSILGAGLGIAAMIVGMIVTLVTIAIAWFVVRPVLGIGLITLAIVALVFGHRLGAGKKAAALAR